jgi:hypothetical protein
MTRITIEITPDATLTESDFAEVRRCAHEAGTDVDSWAVGVLKSALRKRAERPSPQGPGPKKQAA